MKYVRLSIGAPDKQEANAISKMLVEKRLVAGTIITKGNCHYWWENKIKEKEYYTIQAFSLNKNKQKIIEGVKKLHSDECPVIAFWEVDGNKEFLE